MTLEMWDQRFLMLAATVSTWSKDPSTQCGAVIVRQDNTVASLGFNGLPAPIVDDESLLDDRDEKYKRIIHSEMNALLFLRESCRGAHMRMYVWPMVPCVRCMAHIIQAGILHVMAPSTGHPRWTESMGDAVALMDQAGGLIRFPLTQPAEAATIPTLPDVQT